MLRKSSHPLVFINSLSEPKSCYQLCLCHLLQELCAISNNLAWFFIMNSFIAITHLLISLLCIASYLSKELHILVLIKSLIRRKHFSYDCLYSQYFCLFILVCYFIVQNFYLCFVIFIFICCFTFFGFLKYSHLLSKELFLVKVCLLLYSWH